MQVTTLVALTFAARIFINWARRSLQLKKLPALNLEATRENWRNTYLQSARKLYHDGYKKYKDQVWLMATSDGRQNVVVPPQYLPELSKLPESILSFPSAIMKVLEVDYTKTVPDEPVGPYCVRADLNPALSRLTPIIYQEVKDAIKSEMPSCEDWTPVLIYQTLVRIIARVSGRIFVGPELCHDKDYLDTAINYTTELMQAVQAVKKVHPLLRPFLAWRLPEVQNLKKREDLAVRFFKPIVKARRDEAALAACSNDPNYKKPDDMLQWFINRSSDCKSQSTRHLVKMQLLMIFAGIHNTTVTTTNILYSLAVSPEYMQPLRDEIRTCMEGIQENPDDDNTHNDTARAEPLTQRALQQMKRLDSYMKETLRFYPPELTGQYIPPGTFIETPAQAIYQDSTHYPNSDTFDGFRFYKIRHPKLTGAEGSGAAIHARNQFVTCNEQNLAFGYGRHACPGRFLAAAEIKIILSSILLGFDFKNSEDEVERYESHEIGRVVLPEANKPLLFRRTG
ncbi:cytochrome P450 [Aspergillus pseudoustus]|uniref:Cytochrome P450 n=1 Tax=Aspergillus pseudoustus TaxID=1810923 RepID=A0ABR4L237_9EURO